MEKRDQVNAPIVRVVHGYPPIIVHTDLSNFPKTVQELTGLKSKSSKPNINAQLNKDKLHCPLIIKHEDTHDSRNNSFYDNHRKACVNDKYDPIDAYNSDSIKASNKYNSIDNQLNGSLNDEDYDRLIMLSDGSLSPDWTTSLSSYYQQEVTSSIMVWDTEENDCMLVAGGCWERACSRKCEPSPLSKKARFNHPSKDFYCDNQLIST